MLPLALAATALAAASPPFDFGVNDPCNGLDVANAPAVARENCLPGANASLWDVNGVGDISIQGFTTDISALPGETVYFKVDAPTSNKWRIDIFRLGYYRGDGARLVATLRPKVALPQVQPPCLADNDTLLYDCDNWAVSAEWAVPDTAVSGVYFGRAVREDDGSPDEPKSWRTDLGRRNGDRQHAIPGSDPYVEPENIKHFYGRNGFGKYRMHLLEPRASHIWFVIRDDNGDSDILVQTSDSTWQAYNGYGGYTTYGSFITPRTHGPNSFWMTEEQSLRRAHKASYNRPLITRDYRPVNMPLNSEYPLIRFLEANGYDVSYTTCVDSARRGELIKRHKTFVSIGHDEYWARAQREAVTAARDSGTSLMFLSGNSQYWKIRWEAAPQPDPDFHKSDYRVMVCYKDSQSATQLDPVEWTGTWRDGRPINKEGPEPENALTGTIFTANAQRMDAFEVPYVYRNARLWRNTSVRQLLPGQVYRTARGILGHEWDSDIDNGYRPAGLIRLSETTIDNVQYIQDQGSVFDTGTATHHMTLYKHPSGALVWGAGMVQWAWGLDSHHDINDPPRANPYSIRVMHHPEGPDLVLQQATVNMLADMSVQPFHLRGEWLLVPASPSFDVKPPQSHIIVVHDRLDDPEDHTVTVIVTAADDDGVVAGVEFSFDGGKHWHPNDEFVPGHKAGMFTCTFGRNPSAFLYDDPREYKKSNMGTLSVVVRAIDDSGNIEDAHSRTRDEL